MAIVGMLGAGRYALSSSTPNRDNNLAIQPRLAGNLPLIFSTGTSPSYVASNVTTIRGTPAFQFAGLNNSGQNYAYVGYVNIVPANYTGVPQTGKWYIGARVITGQVIGNQMVTIGLDNIAKQYGGSAKPGLEYYIEVIIDWTAKTVAVYVNGAVTNTLTFTRAVSLVAIGSYADGTLSTSMIFGSGYSFGITDIYLVHDADDDVNPTGRLGAVRVQPLLMSGIQGADGWTTTDVGGVALTNINAQIAYNPALANNPDTRTAPGIISSAAETPAIFVPAATATGNIKGVQLDILANRAPTSNTVMVTSAGTDGNMSPDAAIVVSDLVANPGMNTTVSYVFDKSPDGKAWTGDSIATLRLSAKSKRNV